MHVYDMGLVYATFRTVAFTSLRGEIVSCFIVTCISYIDAREYLVRTKTAFGDILHPYNFQL